MAAEGEWVKATWAFAGVDETELTFESENIIRVAEKPHGDWWRGTSTTDGKLGLFPANHVKPVAQQGKAVVVLFEFRGASDTDLSFREGETLEVLEEQAGGWWLGRKKSGEVGMFPSNYVQPVGKKPPPPLPDRAQSMARAKAASTTPPPPPPPASSPPSSSVSPPPPPATTATTAPAASADGGGGSGGGGGGNGDASSSSPSEAVESPPAQLAVIHDVEAFDNMLENGFVVEAITDGTPGTPTLSPGQVVSLHCRAMFWDGTLSVKRQFSSTRGSDDGNGNEGGDNPMVFKLAPGKVTKGLYEGVQTLRVGQRATITCTPEMAYGDAGMPPLVPPNVHVIYDIEVMASPPPGGGGGVGGGGGGGGGGDGGDDGGGKEGGEFGGPEELFRASIDMRHSVRHSNMFEGRASAVRIVGGSRRTSGVVDDEMLSQVAAEMQLSETD